MIKRLTMLSSTNNARLFFTQLLCAFRNSDYQYFQLIYKFAAKKDAVKRIPRNFFCRDVKL